jgi:histidinol-phosphate phosphatase family protein
MDKKKAFFFDRDGIVNNRLYNDYVKSVDEFIIKPDFFELFELVKKNNFLTILVTNQQCISKKIITENKLQEIHNFMQEQLLLKTNYQFDGIFICPDLADTGSKNRKPETGMFIKAIDEFDIDVNISWTIGDAISDVVAGKKVGTKTILIGDFEKVSEADFIFSEHKTVIKFLTNYFLNKING